MKKRVGDGTARSTGAPAPAYPLLLFLCWTVLTAAAAASRALLIRGTAAASPAPAKAITLILILVPAVTGLVVLASGLSAWFKTDCLRLLPLNFRRSIFVWSYPFCRIIGKLLGFSAESVAASFIIFSNLLNLASIRARPSDQLLVLLPRCLQDSQCREAVVEEVMGCKRCKRCDIAALVELMERYRYRMAVVTGGRAAQELVRKLSPSGVVAIACEHELLEGLREIGSIPVVCIPNRRPAGPCKNTEVDIAEFIKLLDSVAAPRQDLPGAESRNVSVTAREPVI